MTLHRDVRDPDGNFVKRIALERVSASEVRYREYDPPDLDNPIEDRQATDEEAQPLISRECNQRRASLREAAETGIDRLETVRDSSGTLTNDQLSDALRLIARVLAALLRMALRKIDAS